MSDFLREGLICFMKKIILWLFKVVFSGLIAFVGLTIFCFIYYNVPMSQEAVGNATDYSWEHGKFYSKATEGFACGRTNNEGYMNSIDYVDGQEIDILVMGSSHMEAYQVLLHESTAAQLGSLLPNDTVYNIGVSNHNFLVCADNFSDAIAKYKPTQYVVLETSELSFTDQQLTSAINETVPETLSDSGGIIDVFLKNQFLRLSYIQVKKFAEKSIISDTSEKKPKSCAAINLELYDELLLKLSNTISKTDVKLIIVYHSNLEIDNKGRAFYSGDTELISSFADLCEKNNILFLNATDRFIQHYDKTHILPHGFGNTSVGKGHLNKHGHKIIAQALYELIKETK